MAVTAGDVVHVIKCILVEVIVQHGDECYAELKVMKGNPTYFLTPRTHLNNTIGTIRTIKGLLQRNLTFLLPRRRQLV